MPGIVLAQLQYPFWVQVLTPGYHDYIIPSGINTITITVTGARGGGVTEPPVGEDGCGKRGGLGAQLSVRFYVGISCQAPSLEPGGTLRGIAGEEGQNNAASGVSGGGGG